MPHKLILTGHARVYNPFLISFIDSDNPNCQGNNLERLCKYSTRCSRTCKKVNEDYCNIAKYYKRSKMLGELKR